MVDKKRSRIDNLKGKKFPKSPQGIDDKKSNGQIKRAKQNNIICTARTLFEASGILHKVIANIEEEVSSGNNRNAIELLKIIKEPETQNIKLDGGVEVQKVFVTKEEQEAVQKHIKDFIE